VADNDVARDARHRATVEVRSEQGQVDGRSIAAQCQMVAASESFVVASCNG
jgi:hypothetical protein